MLHAAGIDGYHYGSLDFFVATTKGHDRNPLHPYVFHGCFPQFAGSWMIGLCGSSRMWKRILPAAVVADVVVAAVLKMQGVGGE